MHHSQPNMAIHYHLGAYMTLEPLLAQDLPVTSLDLLHPRSKFLAMGRALAASTKKSYYPPCSPTSLIQPPISSRPNPFNAPPLSIPSRTLPSLSPPPPMWFWDKASEHLSIPDESYQHMVPPLTALDFRRSFPESPNYLTQNDNINLITEEEDEFSFRLAPLIVPRLSSIHPWRPSPRDVSKRQSGYCTNNWPLQWVFYAVLCWFFIDIAVSSFFFRQPLPPES